MNFKNIKKTYGTDLKTAVEGKWFPLSMIDGAEVKVAKSGNPNYDKMAQKLYKPYQDQLRRRVSLAQGVTDRIQTDLMIGTLLMDWRGFKDDEGNEVPFSKEVAKELVSDPELKELKEEILGFSDNFSAFKMAEDEELEGNSENL